MDKSKKLPVDVIDEINGGSLYISIDGGEARLGNVLCQGGCLAYQTTDSNGETQTFKTDRIIDIFHPITLAEFVGGTLLDSQTTINHTISINSKDFDK